MALPAQTILFNDSIKLFYYFTSSVQDLVAECWNVC